MSNSVGILLKNIIGKERNVAEELPMEQVHLDAATADMLAWGYGETLSSDELAKAAAEFAKSPGHRAAVEAAYRAGQAAAQFGPAVVDRAVRALIENRYIDDVGGLGRDDLEEMVNIVLSTVRRPPAEAASVAKPPPDTSWLQTPEVREGDRRRGGAAS